MTNAEQSITAWFHALQAGDQHAAACLWDRYFERIVSLARNQLIADAAYDGEDLAVSVLGALYDAAQNGRYTALADRDELWALLLVFSQRKMVDRVRLAQAQRRTHHVSSGKRLPEDELPDSDLTPDLSAAVKDECRHLLQLLDDSQLEEIALLKLDGHTIPEIAARLGLGHRTVNRKLLLIRRTWEEELGTDTGDHS